MGGIFLSLSRMEMNFSIGIYPFPMDPMDSIGTTFHPLIQHEWNFSKSLANGKWTFPSESIRFQWIRWTPSEWLPTPSSDMGGIFLSLSRIELNFSIGIYPFPMDPMDSIGTTFHPLIQHAWIFLSLSPIENALFHWNLFVSNGSNTLG